MYNAAMRLTLKDIRSTTPNKPGIYLFKDDRGEVLYVGKAINLKNRVSSYFSKKIDIERPWTAVMVGLAHKLETIVVNNETEALILEATLIKQHMPRFNIKLTDDKSYPYIAYYANEGIPRFTVVRQPTKGKAEYFGPYLSGRIASHTLEFLVKLFGIHSNPRPLGHRDRACLNCQLNNHPCALAGQISEEAYQERINQALDFLKGKRKSLTNILEDRMHQLAERQEFELAAKLRDQLQSVTRGMTRQQVVSTQFDDYDCLGCSVSPALSAVSLLQVREGRIVSQKIFFLNHLQPETMSSVLRQFLVNTYSALLDMPTLLVLPTEVGDQDVIERWFSELTGRKTELRVAERGDKKQISELAEKNAAVKLESRLVQSDRALEGVIALKELLDLAELPIRIEAVDISNLGTSEPVGAVVCFIGGQSDKNEYRRYKIKTVEGQNDFAMIGEVVRRRFSDTARPVPDLFVVDGGLVQLQFAVDALKTCPLQPKAIISLAKKPDRIFRPGRKLPIATSRGHKGLMLLARVRDEVHRFAIGFQRTRQRKKSLSPD